MSKRKRMDNGTLFAIHLLILSLSSLIVGLFGILAILYSSVIFGIFAVLVFIVIIVDLFYATNLVCDSNNSKKKK